jgi:septum formation protein
MTSKWLSSYKIFSASAISSTVAETNLMPSQPFQLILASQSPRRQQLLQEAGYVFTVDPPNDSVEAAVDATLPSDQFVLAASLAKANAIAAKHQQDIVVAADTVADCNGQILGKPTDRNDARRMLETMSSQTHRVLTGVCLIDCQTGRFVSRLEETTLTMDAFPEDQLNSYLDSGAWQGKAGAFGYQDGLDWIHIVEGLASNVVGLPVERLDGWIAELTS